MFPSAVYILPKLKDPHIANAAAENFSSFRGGVKTKDGMSLFNTHQTVTAWIPVF